MNPSNSSRQIVVVVHSGRLDKAVNSATDLINRLHEAGIEVLLVEEDFETMHPLVNNPEQLRLIEDNADITGAELCVVLGGDGSILRAAEIVRSGNIPILGINLGHVGFLAEIEQEGLNSAMERVLAKDYTIDERVVIDITIEQPGKAPIHDWALNEAVIEKSSPEKMVELLVAVDDQPVSSYGADGIMVSSPTGSTAYAFSGGGPIMWPDLEAFLIVPLNAHALFSRPLVLSPHSYITVHLLERNQTNAVAWLDGRRGYTLQPGTKVTSTKSEQSVRLARLNPASFAERLVKKFNLPIQGWRDTNSQ